MYLILLCPWFKLNAVVVLKPPPSRESIRILVRVDKTSEFSPGIFFNWKFPSKPLITLVNCDQTLESESMLHKVQNTGGTWLFSKPAASRSFMTFSPVLRDTLPNFKKNVIAQNQKLLHQHTLNVNTHIMHLLIDVEFQLNTFFWRHSRAFLSSATDKRGLRALSWQKVGLEGILPCVIQGFHLLWDFLSEFLH